MMGIAATKKNEYFSRKALVLRQPSSRSGLEICPNIYLFLIKKELEKAQPYQNQMAKTALIML